VTKHNVAPVVVLPGDGAAVEALGMVHKVWSDWYAGGLSILEGDQPRILIRHIPTPTRMSARSSGELGFDVGGTVAVVGPARTP
jgi:hypothetical protein